MTISIKPTASGSTIEQDGSTILTVDGSGNIDVSNNLTTGGNKEITNTPMVSVVLSTSQSGVSDAVNTKIAFDSVIVDTDSAYDNVTNYRFTVPTGKAGKYFITCGYQVRAGADNDLYSGNVALVINGTFKYRAGVDSRQTTGKGLSGTITTIEDLAEGDYVEVYGDGNSVSGNDVTFYSGSSSDKRCFFSLYRLIG